MKLGKGFRLLACAGTCVVVACDPGIAPLVGTTMEAATADSLVATVGSAVEVAPEVKVLDQEGNPIADVVVTWTVTAGGGGIQRATSTTDEDGFADVGRWTLGTTSGINTLRASIAGAADGTPVPPVIFTAIGRSGPPVSMLMIAGNNQNASTGLQVAARPTVRLSDQFNNPVPNIPVQFQVFSGGGSVTTATQATGANGIASVGWTMGAAVGEQKLNASVTTLGLVQFTATANLSSQCFVRTPYAFASSVGGSLVSTDCLLPANKRVDFFEFVTPTAPAINFQQQSAAFAPYLYLYDQQGSLLAEDLTIGGTTATTSAITLLAPGSSTFLIGASSFQTQRVGDYTLTSSTVSDLVANCKTVFVLRGVVTTQSIAQTDCVDTTGPFYFDRFYIRLVAGVPVTIRMTGGTSPAINAFLELQFAGSQDIAASEDAESPATNNSSITNYVPQVTGYYVILASTQTASTTGTYTLTIDPP